MSDCISADYAKAVLDAVETEHEQNEQRQLEKRGQQQQSIVPPPPSGNLVFDYPSEDDDTFDTGNDH